MLIPEDGYKHATQPEWTLNEVKALKPQIAQIGKLKIKV
jgi:hypothetical protein